VPCLALLRPYLSFHVTCSPPNLVLLCTPLCPVRASPSQLSVLSSPCTNLYCPLLLLSMFCVLSCPCGSISALICTARSRNQARMQIFMLGMNGPGDSGQW
jgi:hypothetical protein